MGCPPMTRGLASLLLVCALSHVAPLVALAEPITIKTVLVGNAGNPSDPSDASAAPGIQSYGSVPYVFRIGTYEVTNAEYAAFLNAKAISDPLGLYSVQMGSDARGGIARSGVSGSFTYAAKVNMGNKPVNFMQWYDAIRFINWLNNGQGNGDTETGAYTLGALDTRPNYEPGIPLDPASITRNAGAVWFLPNLNEWYKAAYYQPADQGGDSDNYWMYPTASNSAPIKATATSVGDISNAGPNVANYGLRADWNEQDGNLTTVGSAGPLSESFYGTSDQGGNVQEWFEDSFTPAMSSFVWRGVRGGYWNNANEGSLAFSSLSFTYPESKDVKTGFRVASISLQADINFDGLVNIFDVNLISAHWGESGPEGDANGDGIVNIFDINLVSSNWTQAGVARSVPEASTSVYVLCSLVTVVFYRPVSSLLRSTCRTRSPM